LFVFIKLAFQSFQKKNGRGIAKNVKTGREFIAIVCIDRAKFATNFSPTLDGNSAESYWFNLTKVYRGSSNPNHGVPSSAVVNVPDESTPPVTKTPVWISVVVW